MFQKLLISHLWKKDPSEMTKNDFMLLVFGISFHNLGAKQCTCHNGPARQNICKQNLLMLE